MTTQTCHFCDRDQECQTYEGRYPEDNPRVLCYVCAGTNVSAGRSPSEDHIVVAQCTHIILDAILTGKDPRVGWTKPKEPDLAFTPVKDQDLESGDEHPNEDDTMTLDDFIQSCRAGYFVDDDGVGEYSKGGERSGVSVSPSEALSSPNREWTHVVWFNK